MLPLLLCLALGNEAVAETNTQAAPAGMQPAQLYLKIGDYYAARQEYEQAAAAYQKAAELPVGSLSPEEQISISERLASVLDIDPAIKNLQRIRREQPANLNARLMLARYLAWDNQPRAATIVADEALALDPGNITAKSIKATVSSWRGDYSTAVPLFEEVLGQEENFDTRLNYYYALTNLGNYLWAADITGSFKPENESQALAVEDLRWLRISKSATNQQYQHEHYGDAGENLDAALDYYRALANLGNYQWATNAATRIKPENEFQAQALEDLHWTIMRKSAPNLQYLHEHYSDSLNNSRSTQSLRLEHPIRNSMTYLALGQSKVSDGYGYSFDLSILEAGLKGALSNATHASAAVGMSRYDHFDTEDVRTAQLRLDHTLSDLQLGAEYRREAYDDFTYIVFNQIKTDKTQLQADYHPSDFWNLKLDYLHTNYSDDNESQELDVAFRYAIHHTPPRINLGYKVERLSFRTQTFHGYYDPDHSGAKKLLLQIYKGNSRYEWGAEGFIGHQDVSRLGLSQDDSIAGWEGFVRAHWLKNLYLEASWEGANYGLNKPYLYRYNLINFRAMVMY